MAEKMTSKNQIVFIDMKKIKKILGLNLKWVKVMLVVSVVAILGLTLYPDTRVLTYETLEIPVEDLPMKSMPEMLGERNDSVVIIEQPVIEELVTAEKPPFDWKGTISWLIGAGNGLALLILNIKNIRKK
jgi:hypothetical protein